MAVSTLKTSGSLSKLEDFMALGMNNLVDFLSVRGLKTSGKKIELVARAFSAVELNLPIIQSSEEQQAKINKEYERRLNKFEICDPLSIEESKKTDDITMWPKLDSGSIFAYILKVRDFDLEYVGRYKDQKAYSYWDSGFVNTVYTYTPLEKQDRIFVYGSVRGSLTASVNHKLWILVKKEPVQILTCWCSCMAGTSQSCNHVIAVMYKIEYAMRKGYLDPSCTSVPCAWNRSTKKEIEPKMIKDVTIRKKLRSKEKDDEPSKEETRRKELQKFNPVLPAYQKITDESVSQLYHNLQQVSPDSVVFKCIPVDILKEEDDKLSLTKIAEDICEKYSDDDEIVSKFLESLPTSTDVASKLELKTRGQSENELWKEARIGRLTASKHHEIYTKVNSIAKSSSVVKPKTTPLTKKILFHDTNIDSLDAIKWGRKYEEVALKQFYAQEATKHQRYKLTTCGLFIDPNKPYIAASPDAIFSCACHGDAVIEIKCPFKIRDKTIRDGVQECDFLEEDSVTQKVRVKRTHKYYTQIISQMAVTGKKAGLFIVWTEKDMMIEEINFDGTHWEKVEQNLSIFFKGYICPVLLGLKQICFCGVCDGVLLESHEISEKEEQDFNSVQCDCCQLWYHLKCQNLSVAEAENLPVEWLCASCIIASQS